MGPVGLRGTPLDGTGPVGWRGMGPVGAPGWATGTGPVGRRDSPAGTGPVGVRSAGLDGRCGGGAIVAARTG
ncbi:MAG TPA: spore surface glycoprotein BclB, partial [Kofleriaceae bacterium]|nr:spore surface glycoprotein BclB [Kofleriaceae bacterium]